MAAITATSNRELCGFFRSRPTSAFYARGVAMASRRKVDVIPSATRNLALVLSLTHPLVPLEARFTSRKVRFLAALGMTERSVPHRLTCHTRLARARAAIRLV